MGPVRALVACGALVATMALSAIALVSVVEARGVLGFDNSSEDAKVERVIEEASSLAENVHCMRPLKQRTITTLRVEGPWNRKLYPEAWPIDPAGTGASAVTVLVNGTAQTLWKSEADGDPDLKDVQVYPDHFYRSLGWAPTGSTERNVVLTYAGGYNPVPEDLKVAVLELIARLWGPLTQQRPDFASMSGPGGSIQNLDGIYGGASVGGGHWSLSRRSKEVFESYRRVRVG